MNSQHADHFGDRLTAAIVSRQTPLVVGIDPRLRNLPAGLRIDSSADLGDIADAFRRFSFELIDVVAPLVPAVKPQAAFFEQLGPLGMLALADVIDHAHASGLLTIMDAKRGDIGSTAAAYAAAYLGIKPLSPWGCDSLTVNPYLGDDSLEPFVSTANQTGSGIFVLAKTSNPGSQTIQEKIVDGKPVYSIVARSIQELSEQSAGESGYGNVGAVIGATYPEQLAQLRQQMPNTIFLIPGMGAQGGTAWDVAGGMDEKGLGAVINSSRAIIFAHERESYSNEASWQRAVERATRDTIDELADATSAGQLRAGC